MKFGFLGGIAQAVYCFGVVLFMQTIEKSMMLKANGMVGLLLFLLVFVFSAGVSAILIFGWPAYMVFQKRFSEALMTAVTSLITLAIVGIFIFILLSLI